MGCKFGKENANELSGNYSPQKKTSINQKGDNLHNLSSGADSARKQYETRIDIRVADKYDIKALIGKGTFSEVLRVESKTSRQPFAIKILKIQSDIEKQLSTSELSALAKISHHFVVKLEEVIISRGVIYLVMQLATGGELYDRIKSRGHFDEKYTCHITQMLLEAISYLHLNGIIHRDLKPENILFYHPGKDSKILITDFGFAKVKTGGMYSDYATTWCGTPEYIGPELIKRLPYDSKVDLWAVGVIVYIMLSGHLPFSAPSSPKLFNLIMNGVYSYRKPVWRDVSDSAKDFINKLLVVDPNVRLDANDARRHEWVNSYSPLHKGRRSFLFSNFNPSNPEKTANSERFPANTGPFQNNNLPKGALLSNVSDKIIVGDGLILPVSGEFQDDIISKEKVLEESMSLTLNTTSTASNPQTIYEHCREIGLHNDSKENQLFSSQPNIEIDLANRHSPPHVADALSLSNKLLAFPLQLNKKVLLNDEFMREDSEYDLSYDSMSSHSLYSHVTLGQSEITFGSHYNVEKVGDCYITTPDTMRETSFSDTLDKTVSTVTTYHSAHSSFDMFSRPQIMKTEEDVNSIALKPLRSADVVGQDTLVYHGNDNT